MTYSICMDEKIIDMIFFANFLCLFTRVFLVHLAFCVNLAFCCGALFGFLRPLNHHSGKFWVARKSV